MSIFHSRPLVGPEEIQACERVLRSGYLASGRETQAFEESLRSHFQRQHAVVVSSGMAALHLSLLALGAKAQARVVLPSYVCTALLNAVGLVGAEPLLRDCAQGEVHMDDAPAESHGDNGKASAPFYIAPQMFGLCKSWHRLPQNRLIEDAAMALGPKALRQGSVSIASFYATKMITSAQGGAILTDDPAIAEEVRDLIAYDNRETYRQRYNYAPNDLCSALGRAQLAKLDVFLARRHALAEQYDELIKQNCPGIFAQSGGLSQHGPGLFRYWVLVGNREACIQHLANSGIESKSPVYKPLHSYLGMSDELFPHATWLQASVLSLPFYPALSEQQVKTVVECLAEVAMPAKKQPSS